MSVLRSLEELGAESVEELGLLPLPDGVDVVFEKWPEMIHVWHLFYPMLTEGRTAISRIGEFIREHT